MHLVRDLLDKQLVDRDGQKIGQVDGVVMELRDGAQPRITAIETGCGVVLDRLGLRSNRRRFRIPLSMVYDVGIDVKVNIDPEDMPIVHWQNWLRRHILSWIPGGSS